MGPAPLPPTWELAQSRCFSWPISLGMWFICVIHTNQWLSRTLGGESGTALRPAEGLSFLVCMMGWQQALPLWCLKRLGGAGSAAGQPSS